MSIERRTCMVIIVRRCLFALVLGLAVSSAASAGSELTLSVGFRFAGDVDAGTIVDTNIDESPSYGLTFDIPLAPEKWIAVLWSRQRSEADLPGFLPDDDTFDLTIDYLHAGGVYRPGGDKRAQGFVMFTVGLTLVSPERSGFDSDVTFSVMIGGGVKFPISERLSFRLDGRAYLTIDEAKLSGICGGVGCSVRFAAGGAIQYEGLAGLTLAF